jgi:hypothetical protein
MTTASVIPMSAGMAAHPNELDRRRIERLLKRRKRYRYVSPTVEAVTSGYRVESPCCSRNIDREGGVVDVALLLTMPTIRHGNCFARITQSMRGNCTALTNACTTC